MLGKNNENVLSFVYMMGPEYYSEKHLPGILSMVLVPLRGDVVFMIYCG